MLAGLLLDAAFGEPRWLWSRLPHPAVLIGRAIAWADTRFNRGAHRRRSGQLVLTAFCLAAIGAGLALQAIPGRIVDVLALAVLLAQRSLVEHVRAVAVALRRSLPEGRAAVARIVGRETSELDEAGIARAAIESAAENLSDGVVAPAFWFALAGLPGLFVYKGVNTADSMSGYRTERHLEFGRAAARLDDLPNLFPARLTALAIWLLAPSRRSWRAIRAEAPRHRSPNAGWPEAAMAYRLGASLSGPRRYDGVLHDYPFVNPAGRKRIGPAQIDAACRVLWQVWVLGVSATIVAALF